MQALSVFFIALAAFATEALASRKSLLQPRSIQDAQPEASSCEVVITKAYSTCTTASRQIRTYCQDGNGSRIEQTLDTVHTSVTHLTSVVQSFDSDHASTHEITVEAIFSSYISIVNSISQVTKLENNSQTTLYNINESFRSIHASYLKVGINLGPSIKNDPDFNEDAFKKLKLSSPLGDETRNSTGEEEESQDEFYQSDVAAPDEYGNGGDSATKK